MATNPDAPAAVQAAAQAAAAQAAVVTQDDLKRIAELASIWAATQDALTDEMVARLAAAFSEGVILLDRLTRNEGLMRLLHALDDPDTQTGLAALADSLRPITRDLVAAPAAKGGIGGLLKLATEPGAQAAFRALSIIGKHWSDSLRESRRRGGSG